MLFSLWNRIGFAVLGDSVLNVFPCSMVLLIFVARGGVYGSVVSVGEARWGRFVAWRGSSTPGAVSVSCLALAQDFSLVAWLLHRTFH